jgi:ribonucleoside-triphosphate reductase
MKLLDKKIYEAKDMLLERFNHMASQPASAAKFMYNNGTMFGYKPEEGIISALKHGTLAIGKLGYAEAAQLIVGCDQTSQEGFDFVYNCELLFNKRCKEFKNEYKLNFGNYETPAENLCHTALKKFRAKYGIIPNVSDRDYFTNSFHVPVYDNIDLFKKIDIESKFCKLSNAGCITYIELDSNCYNNIKAMEEILDYTMDHDVPYQAFNIPISECAECGERIWDDNLLCCPKCGSIKKSVLGRITGYLSTTVEHFNKGKQKEFFDRVKHTSLDI